MLELHRRVPAEPELAENLARELRSLIHGAMSTRDSFLVELLVRELLANAVEHGSKGNSAMTIKIDLSIKNHVLSCWVEDQGLGFDFKTIMATHQKGGERGHGLFILESYTDSFGWDAEGRISWFKRTIKEGSNE